VIEVVAVDDVEAEQRLFRLGVGAVEVARYGGHMHMHSAGIAGPHIGHAAMLDAYSSPHVHHLNHHHRRVFLVGVPYYDYPYDYAYAGSDCWWSRRYHRWFCPNE
jgi:hypothetical protein